MNNPYQTNNYHPVPVEAVVDPNADAIVCSGQRTLIYALLGYLLSMPVLAASNAFIEGTAERPEMTPAAASVLLIGLLIAIASLITASIGIFRMGKILFPGTTRYVYAVGVLVPAPLLGLIVMLVSNSQATKYLKNRGYKVGFFGAKPAS